MFEPRGEITYEAKEIRKFFLGTLRHKTRDRKNYKIV